MKRIVALALAASIIGLSTSSQALEVTTIKYDLSASLENITAPVVGGNPFSAGSMMTLRFTDAFTNSTVDHSAVVDMLSLLMIINPNNIAFVYGALTLAQTSPALGGHLASGNYALGPFAGSVSGTGVQGGFVHCIASQFACSGVGLPNSVAVPIGANSVPFPITVPNLGPQGTPLGPNPIFFGPGLASLSAIRPFGGGLATGSFQLVGVEIARTHNPVPEPGALSMLVLGALGLAGGLAWTRKRAR